MYPYPLAIAISLGLWYLILAPFAAQGAEPPSSNYDWTPRTTNCTPGKLAKWVARYATLADGSSKFVGDPIFSGPNMVARIKYKNGKIEEIAVEPQVWLDELAHEVYGYCVVARREIETLPAVAPKTE